MRTRVLLSLEPEIYEHLVDLSAEQRLAPASYAAAILAEHVRSQKSCQLTPATPTEELLGWVGRLLDQVRERGDWVDDVTLNVFEAIEGEKLPLYRQAAAEQSARTLNQMLGRLIRTKLDAVVVSRGGRPITKRVPRGRTSLLKSYTLLEQEKE